MRSVFIVLSLAVAANAYAYGFGLTAEWERFKETYDKQYSPQDEQFRFKVFTDNFNLIEEHNQKFDQGLYSYDLKMNQFGDMMNHEINNIMNGYRGVGSDEDAYEFIEPDDDIILPRHVNWTKKGVVTPVKNQEACGSCWAFSATGSLEGQHARKDKKLVSLSEQNLVDCSESFGNHGCLGGLMDNAFRYIKSNKGIDSEASYPYKGEDGTCEFKKSAVAATDKGYVDIKHDSEKALGAAVATIGPISAAMDASLSSFHFYHSGVYSDPECSSTLLDHGVLVVGYGDLKKKEFWTVKNSWGTDWGMSGFFLLARNKDNMCGIASNASYPLVAKKKHHHHEPVAIDYDF